MDRAHIPRYSISVNVFYFQVMPDQDTIIDDTEKAPIAAKIALLIGIIPRNYLSDVTPFFSASPGTADTTPLPFKVLE